MKAFNIQKYKKYFSVVTGGFDYEEAKVSLDFSKMLDHFTNIEMHLIAQEIMAWHGRPEIDNNTRFTISSFPHITNSGSGYGGNRILNLLNGATYIDMVAVFNVPDYDDIRMRSRFKAGYSFKDSEDLL